MLTDPQLARLLAATTHSRADHGCARARHIDVVRRMIEHPEQPILAGFQGRRLRVIRRGAHLRHPRP